MRTRVTKRDERRATDSGEATRGGADVSRAARLGVGEHLDATLRSRVEPLFGHAFEKVRIHNDADTAAIAESYGACAVTMGSDIVVDPRHVDLRSTMGQHILAHELAHVVQFERAGQTPSGARSHRGDKAESEAHAAATHIMNSEPAPVIANPSGAIAAWDLFDTLADAGQAFTQPFLDTGQFLGNQAVASSQAISGAAAEMAPFPFGGLFDFTTERSRGAANSTAPVPNTAPAKDGGKGDASSPAQHADMRKIYDMMTPLSNELLRRRIFGGTEPQDNSTTARGGSSALTPETSRMVKYTYDALTPLSRDDEMRKAIINAIASQ